MELVTRFMVSVAKAWGAIWAILSVPRLSEGPEKGALVSDRAVLFQRKHRSRGSWLRCVRRVRSELFAEFAVNREIAAPERGDQGGSGGPEQ